MTNEQPLQQCVIGMVGIGVMGRNLVLNMTGFDKDESRVELLRTESAERDVGCAANITGFNPLLLLPLPTELMAAGKKKGKDL